MNQFDALKSKYYFSNNNEKTNLESNISNIQNNEVSPDRIIPKLDLNFQTSNVIGDKSPNTLFKSNDDLFKITSRMDKIIDVLSNIEFNTSNNEAEIRKRQRTIVEIQKDFDKAGLSISNSKLVATLQNEIEEIKNTKDTSNKDETVFSKEYKKTRYGSIDEQESANFDFRSEVDKKKIEWLTKKEDYSKNNIMSKALMGVGGMGLVGAGLGGIVGSSVGINPLGLGGLAAGAGLGLGLKFSPIATSIIDDQKNEYAEIERIKDDKDKKKRIRKISGDYKNFGASWSVISNMSKSLFKTTATAKGLIGLSSLITSIGGAGTASASLAGLGAAVGSPMVLGALALLGTIYGGAKYALRETETSDMISRLPIFKALKGDKDSSYSANMEYHKEIKFEEHATRNNVSASLLKYSVTKLESVSGYTRANTATKQLMALENIATGVRYGLQEAMRSRTGKDVVDIKEEPLSVKEHTKIIMNSIPIVAELLFAKKAVKSVIEFVWDGITESSVARKLGFGRNKEADMGDILDELKENNLVKSKEESTFDLQFNESLRHTAILTDIRNTSEDLYSLLQKEFSSDHVRSYDRTKEANYDSRFGFKSKDDVDKIMKRAIKSTKASFLSFRTKISDKNLNETLQRASGNDRQIDALESSKKMVSDTLDRRKSWKMWDFMGDNKRSEEDLGIKNLKKKSKKYIDDELGRKGEYDLGGNNQVSEKYLDDTSRRRKNALKRNIGKYEDEIYDNKLDTNPWSFRNFFMDGKGHTKALRTSKALADKKNKLEQIENDSEASKKIKNSSPGNIFKILSESGILKFTHSEINNYVQEVRESTNNIISNLIDIKNNASPIQSLIGLTNNKLDSLLTLVKDSFINLTNFLTTEYSIFKNRLKNIDIGISDLCDKLILNLDGNFTLLKDKLTELIPNTNHLEVISKFDQVIDAISNQSLYLDKEATYPKSRTNINILEVKKVLNKILLGVNEGNLNLSNIYSESLLISKNTLDINSGLSLTNTRLSEIKNEHIIINTNLITIANILTSFKNQLITNLNVDLSFIKKKIGNLIGTNSIISDGITNLSNILLDIKPKINNLINEIKNVSLPIVKLNETTESNHRSLIGKIDDVINAISNQSLYLDKEATYPKSRTNINILEVKKVLNNIKDSSDNNNVHISNIGDYISSLKDKTESVSIEPNNITIGYLMSGFNSLNEIKNSITKSFLFNINEETFKDYIEKTKGYLENIANKLKGDSKNTNTIDAHIVEIPKQTAYYLGKLLNVNKNAANESEIKGHKQSKKGQLLAAASGGTLQYGEKAIVGDSIDGKPTGYEELIVPQKDGSVKVFSNDETVKMFPDLKSDKTVKYLAEGTNDELLFKHDEDTEKYLLKVLEKHDNSQTISDGLMNGDFTKTLMLVGVKIFKSFFDKMVEVFPMLKEAKEKIGNFFQRFNKFASGGLLKQGESAIVGDSLDGKPTGYEELIRNTPKGVEVYSNKDTKNILSNSNDNLKFLATGNATSDRLTNITESKGKNKEILENNIAEKNIAENNETNKKIYKLLKSDHDDLIKNRKKELGLFDKLWKGFLTVAPVASIIAGGLYALAKDVISDIFKMDSNVSIGDNVKKIMGKLFSVAPEGGMFSSLGAGAKYATMGFVAGSIIPGIGNITGALIGGAIGAVLGYIGQNNIDKFIENSPIAKMILDGTNYVISWITKPFDFIKNQLKDNRDDKGNIKWLDFLTNTGKEIWTWISKPFEDLGKTIGPYITKLEDEFPIVKYIDEKIKIVWDWIKYPFEEVFKRSMDNVNDDGSLKWGKIFGDTADISYKFLILKPINFITSLISDFDKKVDNKYVHIFTEGVEKLFNWLFMTPYYTVKVAILESERSDKSINYVELIRNTRDGIWSWLMTPFKAVGGWLGGKVADLMEDNGGDTWYESLAQSTAVGIRSIGEALELDVLWDGIVSDVKEIWTGFSDWMSETIGDSFDFISSGDFANSIGNILNESWEFIKSIGTTIVDYIMWPINQIKDWIGEKIDPSKNKDSFLGNIFKSIEDIFESFKKPFDDIYNFISNLGDIFAPIKALFNVKSNVKKESLKGFGRTLKQDDVFELEKSVEGMSYQDIKKQADLKRQEYSSAGAEGTKGATIKEKADYLERLALQKEKGDANTSQERTIEISSKINKINRDNTSPQQPPLITPVQINTPKVITPTKDTTVIPLSQNPTNLPVETQNIIKSNLSNPDLKFFAEGGEIKAGEQAIVGENGPELVIQSSKLDNFIKPFIKQSEGLELTQYIDSVGKPTIGYGHLVKKGEDFSKGITKPEAEKLFDDDFKSHKKEAEKIEPYGKANLYQKAALIDLTYNMGPNWYKKFPKAYKAMSENDWIEAAKEMKDSRWAKQVGKRSDRVISWLRNTDGSLPEGIDIGPEKGKGEDGKVSDSIISKVTKPSQVDLSSLKIKDGSKGQALAGGETNQATLALAGQIQTLAKSGDIPKFRWFTAFNDLYHKGTSSKHARGLALDFSLENGSSDDYKKAADAVRTIGKKSNIELYVQDEKNKPSGRSTGPHIHVDLRNDKNAEKYLSGTDFGKGIDTVGNKSSTSNNTNSSTGGTSPQSTDSSGKSLKEQVKSGTSYLKSIDYKGEMQKVMANIGGMMKGFAGDLREMGLDNGGISLEEAAYQNKLSGVFGGDKNIANKSNVNIGSDITRTFGDVWNDVTGKNKDNPSNSISGKIDELFGNTTPKSSNTGVQISDKKENKPSILNNSENSFQNSLDSIFGGNTSSKSTIPNSSTTENKTPSIKDQVKSGTDYVKSIDFNKGVSDIFNKVGGMGKEASDTIKDVGLNNGGINNEENLFQKNLESIFGGTKSKNNSVLIQEKPQIKSLSDVWNDITGKSKESKPPVKNDQIMSYIEQSKKERADKESEIKASKMEGLPSYNNTAPTSTTTHIPTPSNNSGSMYNDNNNGNRTEFDYLNDPIMFNIFDNYTNMFTNMSKTYAMGMPDLNH